MSEAIEMVSDEIFDHVVSGRREPVLVDFWAEWCGPCKAMLPALEEAAAIYEGRLTVLKLNVTENPKSAERFGARSIPLMILFREGVEQARVVGAMPMSRLCHFIDTNLGEDAE